MTAVLLDTGPIVAWFDRSDSNHERCVAYLQGVRDQFVTTEAVLTEALHFLRPAKARANCFELLRRLRVRFANVTAQGLARAETLMRQYSDLPMDYADASLVVAAEMLDLDTVLTLDDRGFRVYRIGGARPFRLAME